MHDQHDDPLERELSRLSQYTGEPASIWQQAIDKHRRDQHQKLWVWVRRPAPALAAASLALLVAAVALRPIGPVSPADASRAALSDAASKERYGDVPAARTLAPAANEPAAGNFSKDQLPRDITQNTKGLENYNVRSNDRQDERSAPQVGGLVQRNNDTAGGIHSPAPSAPAPTESGSNLASRGGVNAPGRASPAGAHPGADLARKAGASAPEPDSGAPMPAVAATPAHPAGGGGGSHGETGEKLAAKREEGGRMPADADAVESKAAATDPLEQTATVRLAVADVNRFYYEQVPELLDVKNGESFAGGVLQGAEAKDASAGFNVTLRVSEDRLPQIIEELRRAGNVQTESTQLSSKQDRLKQIDNLVAENEGVLKKAAVVDKSKAAPASGAPGAAAGKVPAPKTAAAEDPVRLKAQDSIAALNRRRSQIEQGRELATLNIIAVPEIQPPPTVAKPATPPTPPPAMPTNRLATAPPAAPLPAGEAGKPGEPSDAEANKADGDPAYKNVLPAATPAAAPASSSAGAPNAQPAPGTGKITRAAKEGWSSFGDTTADFIRSAIGTMLYWLPALIAAIAALWWWRRRTAAAMREPPPQ